MEERGVKDLPQTPRCARASCRRLASQTVPSKAGIPRDLCTAHAAEVARFILDRPENRELVWALDFYFKLSERAES